MFDYGHLQSVRRSSCLDAEGHPVPWFSYPAIEFLKQLDFSESAVFEYGAGNSTLFWAGRANRIVSVEHDDAWHQKISEEVPPNTTLILASDPDEYVGTIDREHSAYDVIVVDGLERRRCCQRAIEKLRIGGVVILDNSDWFPKSAALLRRADLIQIDMTGFAPLAGHTTTTSLFLHRQVKLLPAHEQQPVPGPGSIQRLTGDASAKQDEDPSLQLGHPHEEQSPREP